MSLTKKYRSICPRKFYHPRIVHMAMSIFAYEISFVYNRDLCDRVCVAPTGCIPVLRPLQGRCKACRQPE